VARDAKVEARDFDHNVDRYPTVAEALRKVINDPNFEGGVVERVDVRVQANGEVTYRYWEPRAEEPGVGFIPAPG
jgi:hypothetical protein